jgi:hypothetical protein
MLYRGISSRILVSAFFYLVDIRPIEAAAKKEWLVHLLCTEHKRFPKESACAVAESAVRQSFGDAAVIGHRAASKYTGALPSNLGTAHFTAQCGCRAWPMPY